MPDYEIWAPDAATMQSALNSMSLKANSGKLNNVIFAIDNYGTKYVQSGTRTDQFGRTWPDYAAQTGVYANLRWLGATAVPPLPAGSGCTIKLLTNPVYRTFATRP